MTSNEGKVDLHIHSRESNDGDFSVYHILHLAKEKNFRAVSIADHDTVRAYPHAIQIGEELEVEVIPNIELTTVLDNREFHLLLPFVDWKGKVISGIVKEVFKRRVREAKQRVRKLQQMGFDISWKEVTTRSGSHPPLGVTIAQLLLQKAKRKKDSPLHRYFQGKESIFAPYQFYQDYFMEGKPACVPKQNMPLVEVLDRLTPKEGVPVLAHPGAYFQQTGEKDLILLKERGLKGLEVFSSYHERKQTLHYRRLTEKLDLVPTAGSDFHGRIKPHIPFGCLEEGEYWMVQELKKRRA